MKIKISIILYKLTLDLVYLMRIVPVYSYAGFTLNYSTTSIVISNMVFLIFLFTSDFSIANARPSKSIIIILFYLYVIPSFSFIAYSSNDMRYLFYFSVYWFFIIFFHRMTKRINIPKIKIRIVNQQFVFELSIYFISVFALFATIYYNGFKIKIDLKDIYTIRSYFSTVERSTFVRYLIDPAAIVIPVGIVHFFQNRRYVVVSLLVLIQLAIYAMGAHKFVLFLLVLTLLASIFYKKKYFDMIPLGLVALNLIAFLEPYGTKKHSMIVDYIQRRVLFVPSFLSFKYYEFFTTHAIDYFKQSFLRHLGIRSAYSTTIPKVIGEVMLNESTHANTGLIGDAFQNLGVVGLVIFPLLLVGFLFFFDYCSRDIEPSIMFVTSVILAIKFISGTFTSILLSGGVLIVCIYLYLYPRNNAKIIEYS